ncbi:hypothetical protein MXB_1808 [Myxobolus squamalis]|nr:hypothetical protein MXB_1808 [Myxobolus squamalis]
MFKVGAIWEVDLFLNLLRPTCDIGTVATSILYRTQDKFYAFNPQFMDTSHFYFTFDHQLLEDNFRNEMNYLRTNWKLEGRPTIVLSISSRLLQDNMDSVIGQFIKKLSTGHYYGIRVKLGTLTDFLSTSCITEWDFMSSLQISQMLGNMCMIVQKMSRRLSSVFQRSTNRLDSQNSCDHEKRTKFDSQLRQSTHLMTRLSSSISQETHTPPKITAGCHKLWVLLRYTAGYLRKDADGLAQAATSFIIRQKQFTVGYPSFREDVISSPLIQDELKNLIYESYQEDVTSAILAQEVMIYLSMFIKTEPHLFGQMIRLRLGLIVEVAACEFAREAGIPRILSETPQLTSETISSLDEDGAFESDKHGLWYRRRCLDGSLNRVPDTFFYNVWTILNCCEGISLAGYALNNVITQEA